MEGLKFYFGDESTYFLAVDNLKRIRLNSSSDKFGHRLEVFSACENVTPIVKQLRPLFDINISGKTLVKVEWLVGESVLDTIQGSSLNAVCTLSREWVSGTDNTYTEVINISEE